LDIQINPQGKERPIRQRRSPAAFSGGGRRAFSRPWVLKEMEAAAGVGADGGAPAKGLASAGCAAVGFGQLRRRCRIDLSCLQIELRCCRIDLRRCRIELRHLQIELRLHLPSDRGTLPLPLHAVAEDG